MAKELVKIVVRVVERPKEDQAGGDQPYRPGKRAVFKAIATCEIGGKRLSRTATNESEALTRRDAYSKLATLVAKSGGVPAPGNGVEM